MTPERDVLAEGFLQMRSGILYMLIGSIIAVLGLILMYPLVLLPLFADISAGELRAGIGLGIVGGLFVSLLSMTGLIISLWGLYFKFLSGVSSLAKSRQSYSLPALIIKIGYVGGAILMIIGIFILLPFLLIGLAVISLLSTFLTLLASVLFFIGLIGLILLSFYLYKDENEPLYLIAAIMMVISIVIGITFWIGLILLYIALGNSAEKIKMQSATMV